MNEEWNILTNYELAKRDDELQSQLKSLQSCLVQLLDLLLGAPPMTELELTLLREGFRKLRAQICQLELGES